MSTAGNQSNTANSDGKYNNDNQNRRNHAPSSNANKPNFNNNKNKNNRNSNTNNTNNVAPLRPQNFNSVANDQIPPQAPNTNKNLKPNGGPKKQNKKKGKNGNNIASNNANANDNNKVETINQQEAIDSQNPDRLNKSLSNEQMPASSFPTSISLDNIGYCNQNMNKISPSKMTNSASFSNTCNLIDDLVTKQEETIPAKETLNVESVPETETVTDEAKQNPLNESETSLEFTSCCSTPMSINETKSEIKPTIELERVIKSLDFKSNDILAIDMEQFNQTSEENEETTTYIDNDVNVLQHQEQEEEQVSVIEAKPSEQFDNDVPALVNLDEYLQKMEDNSNAKTLSTKTDPISNLTEFIPVQTHHENMVVEQITPIIFDSLKETTVAETPVEKEIQLTTATQETQIKELVPEIEETIQSHNLVENTTKEIAVVEISETTSLSNMIGNVIEEIQIKEPEIPIEEFQSHNLVENATKEIPLMEINEVEQIQIKEVIQEVPIDETTQLNIVENATKEITVFEISKANPLSNKINNVIEEIEETKQPQNLIENAIQEIPESETTPLSNNIFDVTEENQIMEIVPETKIQVENSTKEILVVEIPEATPNMIGNVIEEIQIKEVFHEVQIEETNQQEIMEDFKEKVQEQMFACRVLNSTGTVSQEISAENITNKFQKMDDLKTNTKTIDLKQEKGEVTAYVQKIVLEVLENTQQKAPDSTLIDSTELLIPEQLIEKQTYKDEEVLDNNFVLITSPIIMDEEKTIDVSASEPLLSETADEIEAEVEAKPLETTTTTTKSSKQNKKGNDKKADPAVDCFPCSIL